MDRLPNWRANLTQYLASQARREFKEGSHDCALFANGAIEAMTGVNLVEKWGKSYSSTKDGLRKLKADGFSDHIALAKSMLPVTETPRPGDIAVVPQPELSALGVVQGSFVYVPGPRSLVVVAITEASQFLKV